MVFNVVFVFVIANNIISFAKKNILQNAVFIHKPAAIIGGFGGVYGFEQYNYQMIIVITIKQKTNV